MDVVVLWMRAPEVYAWELIAMIHTRWGSAAFRKKDVYCLALVVLASLLVNTVRWTVSASLHTKVENQPARVANHKLEGSRQQSDIQRATGSPAHSKRGVYRSGRNGSSQPSRHTATGK